MIMLQNTDAVFDIKPDPCNRIVCMIFIYMNGRKRLYLLTIDIVDSITMKFFIELMFDC